MPTTRISKMRRPSAIPTSRLPALRESATALLRALSNGKPTTQDIARSIALDPVLVFELLLTAPLGGNDPEKLLDAIANRIAGIDAGLLQGWSLRHVIQQPQRRIGARSHRHHARPATPGRTRPTAPACCTTSACCGSVNTATTTASSSSTPSTSAPWPPPNGSATASTTPSCRPTSPPAAGFRRALPTPSRCTRPSPKASSTPTRWYASWPPPKSSPATAAASPPPASRAPATSPASRAASWSA